MFIGLSSFDCALFYNVYNWQVDGNYGEKVMVVDKEEALVERRMDLETQDYGGTGANTDHEPKPPRRI